MKMGFEIDPMRTVCKHKSGVVIDTVTGEYYGEFDLKSGLPHGRGLFRGANQIIHIGYFDFGLLAEGKCIEINLTTLAFSVCYRSRTEDGRLKEQGVKGLENGKLVTGVWIDGAWFEDTALKVSPDFFDWSLSLKSTISSTLKASKDMWLQRSYGLHNDKNGLHGRGIFIDRMDTIHIGYWVNG